MKGDQLEILLSVYYIFKNNIPLNRPGSLIAF